MTTSLLKNVLASYGEHELADDEELLQEMIDAATSATRSNTTSTTARNPFLTVDLFARGLTKDVELYDIRNEVRAATNLDDVFLEENEAEDAFNQRIAAAAEHEVRKVDIEDPSESTFMSIADNVRDLNTVRVKLKRVNTLPQIDPIAGT